MVDNCYLLFLLCRESRFAGVIAAVFELTLMNHLQLQHEAIEGPFSKWIFSGCSSRSVGSSVQSPDAACVDIP